MRISILTAASTVTLSARRVDPLILRAGTKATLSRQAHRDLISPVSYWR